MTLARATVWLLLLVAKCATKIEPFDDGAKQGQRINPNQKMIQRGIITESGPKGK